MSQQLKECVAKAIAHTDNIIRRRALVIGKEITSAEIINQLYYLPPPAVWFGPVMEGADVQTDVLPDFIQDHTTVSKSVWFPVFTLQLREVMGERQWASLVEHMAWVLCADQIPGSSRLVPEYFQYWPWTSWLRRSWLSRIFSNPCKCLAQHLHDHPYELVCVTLYFYQLEMNNHV